MDNDTRLTGLIAAPHTPFDSNLRLNLDAVEAQATWLADQGVRGVFICGTTGEGASLTVDERCALAERWNEVVADRLDLIIHVGHNCWPDACALAAHARELGNVRAIGFMSPTFFKPESVTQLIDLSGRIADAAGDLPLYYYHIPAMTGVSVSMVEYLRQAKQALPTLRGIKFTHNDLLEYRECVTLEDGYFDILFGRDELLLAGLAYGARGAVGSTYNYAAPLYLRMMAAFERGDLAEARRLADRSIAMVRCVLKLGLLPAAKAIMQRIGADCGPPRPPFEPLSEAGWKQLDQWLASGELPVEVPSRARPSQ